MNLYDTPQLAAFGFFIGKKRSDSAKELSGKWHILGETQIEKETDMHSLIRCAGEEAGLEITVGKYIGCSRTPSGRNARWYECFAKSGNIRAGSDLEELKWVEKSKALDECDNRKRGCSPEIIGYFKSCSQ